MSIDKASSRLTRRSLLQNAGRCLALSVLPIPRRFFALPISRTMLRLSAYMAEAHDRALPEDVLEKTRYHLLDTLAAMISGSQLTPGIAALRFARAYTGSTATIIASDARCDAMEAALTNGILAHSDETDDSHAPSQSHPGCAIVPSALAAGEQFGVDGATLLRSVALGYDIGTRITMTLGAAKFQTETHRSTHAIAGTFGAAAAAACAAKLTAQQMRWVLDYSAQEASGIAAWQRDTEHIEKAFVFAGMPARAGITAALLVNAGWTGVDDIFSGPDNFLAASVPQADPSGLIDKLGERYEITRTNIKKWTVGSPIQAPLDAIEVIRRENSFDAAQVASVVVRVATPEAAVVDNREIPDICLQHMIAVMLVDGTASFRSAHDVARMHDSAILRVREKVRLVADEDLARLLPKRVAVVEVTLKDGEHFSKRVDAVRGTAENPMSRDEVLAKARDLIAPVLGADHAKSLIDAVFKLEDGASFREMMRLLSGKHA